MRNLDGMPLTMRSAALVAAGFVALALVLRAPALLYSVLNYDESMYLLMGDKLRQGFLPYTYLCDLKPVGLFAVFALISALPIDGVIAMRLVAAITVGLTAFLVWRVAQLLFDDEDGAIAPAAGLTYVVFMLAAGGLNAQSELFMNGLTMAALLAGLVAAREPGRPRLGLFLLAGLLFGIGLQVKQVVAFDMLAFLIGFFLLTTPRPAALVGRVRESLLAFVALGAVAAVPTLVVMLTYALSGQWDAWVAGNITAHRVFYGDKGPPIAWEPGFRVIIEQAPLWIAAILCLLFGSRLARDGSERRALGYLLIWVGLLCACQVFLRFMADHYFLQFVPVFSLLTAFLLGRTVIAWIERPAARRVLLAGLVALGTFAVAKNPIVNALYIATARYYWNDPLAGDSAREVAADIKRDLRPGESIYVVGFMPIVYYLTGAEIPTGFAFTGLPNRRYPGRDGCPYVESTVELQRVLDSRPRFIVVEQGVFFNQLPPDHKDPLLTTLERHYRLREEYGQHWMHRAYPFERFVMNGATRATLYERVEAAPPSPPSSPPVS